MNVIGEIVMPVKRWWRLLHDTASIAVMKRNYVSPRRLSTS